MTGNLAGLHAVAAPDMVPLAATGAQSAAWLLIAILNIEPSPAPMQNVARQRLTGQLSG